MFSRTLCFCVLYLLFAFSAFPVSGESQPNRSGKQKTARKVDLPEEELGQLTQAIKAASSYREDLRRDLDAMEDSLVKASDNIMKCRMALKLAKKFRPVNTDSSLFYAKRARVIADYLGEEYKQLSEIAVIDALATAGLFTEALNVNSENGDAGSMGRFGFTATWLPEVRLDYWLTARRLYGYMESYAEGNYELAKKYGDKSRQYDDSLIMHLPSTSPLRRFLESERYVRMERYHEAEEGLQKLLSELPQESNLYGMAAFQMATVWLNLGDERRYAAMLALSALSDVKCCVSEGLALPTLAEWLYGQGELTLSFSYINFALEEASSGNARMRAVTIARFVPLIDDAYKDKINSSRDELMVYFLLVTILLIVTAALTVFLVRQIKKTKANARKLVQTSRRQESYIGNFIGLYSRYADRLNKLAKLVSTKLAAGQVAELKKLMDSGKFTDQDNDDIHKIFDSAFLDIYPDFVAEINTLLRPEEAISVKSDDSLTPELRIYAFVKLGIDESSRIAQILHYSTNTVYAYRNKMRNKAIKRDSFDDDVKGI